MREFSRPDLEEIGKDAISMKVRSEMACIDIVEVGDVRAKRN